MVPWNFIVRVVCIVDWFHDNTAIQAGPGTKRDWVNQWKGRDHALGNGICIDNKIVSLPVCQFCQCFRRTDRNANSMVRSWCLYHKADSYRLSSCNTSKSQGGILDGYLQWRALSESHEFEYGRFPFFVFSQAEGTLSFSVWTDLAKLKIGLNAQLTNRML